MKKVLIPIALGLWVVCDYPVLAQVSPDTTLGTRVTRNGDGFEITGGTTRGRNQFHSFQEFSVPENLKAFFNNNSNIANIISRVTGRNISNILGTIKANGNANLILINPNGIFFGPKAKLDIRGSFLGSTANGVIFADGTVFSANATDRPILTVSVPLGLQLNNAAAPITVQGSNLEVIPNQTLALVGGKLVVNGGTLTAPGGQIELGATRQSTRVNFDEDFRLSFPVGIDFNDISLTNAGELNVVATSNSSDGGVVNIYGRNVELTNGARINASTNTVGFDAGNVTINATDTVNIDGVILVEDGPDPDTIRDPRRSGIATNVGNGAEGKGGNILINTDNFNITNGGVLNTATSATGNAGNVTINATNTVTIDGLVEFQDLKPPVRSQVNTNVAPTGRGSGGEIIINTGSLKVTGGAQLNASTGGNGNAGNVTINATDTVTVKGVNLVKDGDADEDTNPDQIRSQILTNVGLEAGGNGGNIFIETGSLNVSNGGQLNASTNGNGNAGNITINATDTVTIDGVTKFPNNPDIRPRSEIVSNVSANPNERFSGGEIVINTNSLNIFNGGQIASSSIGANGKGDAGSITIIARDTVNIEGFTEFPDATTDLDNLPDRLNSDILSQVRDNQEDGSPLEGNAGNIVIETGSINLSNGARLATSVTGQSNGNAGEIKITAREGVFLDSAIIQANGSFGKSNAGSIIIDTTSFVADGSFVFFQNPSLDSKEIIQVVRGSLIQTSLFGTGVGGTIYINASENISLQGPAEFGDGNRTTIQNRVEKGGIGDAGDIIIKTSSLELTDGAAILAGSSGKGKAGEINITADERVILEGERAAISSRVSDSATESEGGLIVINTDYLLLSEGAGLNTETEGQGNAGEIDITTNSLEITEGGSVNSSTRSNGIGDAGKITINATQGIVLDGVITTRNNDGEIKDNPSKISSEVEENGQGNAGEIVITTPSLELTNGGTVNTGSEGMGDAGKITINATQGIVLDGVVTTVDSDGEIKDNPSKISSEVEENGQGNAGEIVITTPSLELTNGAIISTESQDNLGGNINLTVTDVLRLSNNSQISATANEGSGDGGNININTSFLILDNSTITANAEAGSGGEIRINTEGIFCNPNCEQQITADSGTGIDGTVEINTLDSESLQSDNVPEQNNSQSVVLAQSSCNPRVLAKRSHLSVRGRDGLPPSPREPLSESAIVTFAEPSSEEASQPDSTPTIENTNLPLPARGWYVNEKGNVVLTSAQAIATPYGIELIAPECVSK